MNDARETGLGRSRHDVLIVGGGHNGLTAGCVLARHGLDVLVLEAGATFGGQATTLPLVAEAPQHRISPYAVDDIFLTAGGLVDELGLRRFGYRDLFVDPSYVYLHPDGRSLAFWQDARRTAAEIRAFSPADADAYEQLMHTVEALLDLALPLMKANPQRPGARTLLEVAWLAARRVRRLPGIAWLMIPSAAQAIAERFSHPIVQNALAQLAATCVGPIDTDGSAIALMAPGFPHRFGTRRPIGGTYTLVAALLACLKEAGGAARASAPVAEILLAGGERATGVRLETGEEIDARVGIISSCDPVQTLARLLPAGTLDRVTQARVDHIPTAASGVSAFKVDLALNGRLNLDRWRRPDFDVRLPAQMFADSLASVVRSCRHSRRGEVPVDDIHAFTAIATHADGSLAPDGQDTLYLYVPVSPVDPHGGWPQHADRAADAIVAKAAEFFGGVLELELGRCVQSPAELARRVHATLGATVSHVDYLPHRLGPLRPAAGLGGYRTPITGLYLGGSGCHPGFGMTGLPGRLSARELLRRSPDLS